MTLTQQQMDTQLDFIEAFDTIARGIEEWADRKGWNSDDPRLRITGQSPAEGATAMSDVVHYDIAKIGLMVTELAEAIEGRRHNDPPSDKIPAFTAQEEELADCVVRIMHYAAHNKLRVAEALIAKLDYNEGRAYKHGKQA